MKMAAARGEADANDGEEDNNLFKEDADGQWNEEDDENDIIF